MKLYGCLQLVETLPLLVDNFAALGTTIVTTQVHRKDKALERRFQQVMIDQPSPEDTISIRAD
jgi:hypothetical protein